MSDSERGSTQDQAEITGQPCCFKCERPIQCGIRTEDPNDYWEFPQGLVMTGGNNFGSTLYDAMMDGKFVTVLICDDCLTKHKHLLREVVDKDCSLLIPDPHGEEDDLSATSRKALDGLTPEKATELFRKIMNDAKDLKVFELEFLVEGGDLDNETKRKISKGYGDEVSFVEEYDPTRKTGQLLRFNVCFNTPKEATDSVTESMKDILPDMKMKLVRVRVVEEGS